MTDLRAAPAASDALAILREQPVPDPAVPRMELAEWATRYGIVAGVTTREHGFNLGLWSGDNVGQVMTRWRALRAAFQPRFPTLILSHQVHGTRVEWHEQRADGWLIQDGSDGHVTSTPGVLLTVTVADCIPVYLAVPEKGAVGLLHAGWRGAADRILERALEVVKRHAFTRAADVVMHCGTGICGTCYEVGPEVLARFGTHADGAAQPLDLRAALVEQARWLGVREISVSPWCSAHDRERFFSHRASGGRDGRMVAYLGRPLA